MKALCDCTAKVKLTPDTRYIHEGIYRTIYTGVCGGSNGCGAKISMIISKKA